MDVAKAASSGVVVRASAAGVKVRTGVTAALVTAMVAVSGALLPATVLAMKAPRVITNELPANAMPA
jgi:hypothetical protein